MLAGVSQRTSIGGKAVSEPSKCCQRQRWNANGGERRSNDETLSPTTPIGVSECQSIPLDILITMVPSVRGKSTWIVNTVFCANWRNFDNWSKPIRAFFEVTVLNPYSWRKGFLMVYYMFMFEIICKKSHFSRLIVKNISVTMPCFACKANRDSESGTKKTPGQVSMPQIQWQSQIWQTSFR